MSTSRLRRTISLLSLGAEIFGWMEIQVHVNMVDRQLQSTFNVDLSSNLLASRVKTEKWVSVGVLRVGRAKECPNKRHSKVKRIMVLKRCQVSSEIS